MCTQLIDTLHPIRFYLYANIREDEKHESGQKKVSSPRNSIWQQSQPTSFWQSTCSDQFMDRQALVALKVAALTVTSCAAGGHPDLRQHPCDA
jgi:hypothetical protein